MASQATSIPDLRSRFLTWVLVDDESGCWNWQRGRSHGYGIIGAKTLSPSPLLAHRAAYRLFVGDTPTKTDVHHLCRNKLCCNPDHLELLTARQHSLLHNAPNGNCKEGHNNWRTNKDGSRRCRECDKLRSRRRRNSDSFRAWERDYRRKKRAELVFDRRNP